MFRADVTGSARQDTVEFGYLDPSKLPARTQARCRARLGGRRVPTIRVYPSLAPSGHPIWARPLCGGGWLFGRGTGIYKVGDVVPHLIVFLYVGPSYGADLMIWRWRNGGMKRVPLPPQLSRGVSPFYTTWLPPGGQTLLVVAPSNKDSPQPPALLGWAGTTYIDVSTDHPEYYRTHFKVAASKLLSGQMPPDGWMHAADFNIRLLLLEKRPRRAVWLCRELLDALVDRNRTPPPSSPDGPGAKAAYAQSLNLAQQRVKRLLDESISASRRGG